MRLRQNPEQPESDTGSGHPEAGEDRPGIGLREFLARQQVQLDRQRVELEGHVAEAERRLGELEGRTAQAELRAANAERKLEQAERRAADAERKIEHAERRAVDAERKIEQAERRAADAERKLSSSKLKPRAARQLAEARREAEQLGRERALLKSRVAELIAQVDALQRAMEGDRSEHEAREADLKRRLAESGAEHAREHAMRMDLVERLGAEVKERQRIERELDALEQSYTRSVLAVEQEQSEALRARSSDDGFATRSARAPGAGNAESGVHPAAGALSAGDPPTDGPFPAETPAHRNEMRRKRLHFLRRRSSLPCAVCRRPRPAMSDAEATASGWELAGAGALCPTCRQAGWQFPPGATVPFRAAGPRSSA
jgi:chromosome segregation ATPase